MPERKIRIPIQLQPRCLAAVNVESLTAGILQSRMME